MRLGVQGKVEQRLGGAVWLGGAERRLGGVGEAAELCGAAELLGVPLTITDYSHWNSQSVYSGLQKYCTPLYGHESCHSLGHFSKLKD